ncbi:DUF2267 domain-containing protein [Microbispora hainanensis]|uniref:DUF2267 domain-containing protein n=1 Tax=Microbispora hainanensis TaxID=568844 RepID=A0ABZ1T0H2_9ACTN|nr:MULTISPECIES: DUF2267 domain-containing protein [Microbispora]NJP23344.1 DUF2267 domain-containing protein [Microbispora sp. CL1-1]TQS16410.1 DUF2267 domain-containing protein [Microbispora sp. SCL1-1]
MDHRDFFGRVAERSGLSREEAADLSRATLELLGDRLSATEAQHLAFELPEPLRESVHVSDSIQRLGFREFVVLIGKRTGLTEEEARGGIRAVLLTLRDAVPDETFDHAMSQLPAEFQQAAE